MEQHIKDRFNDAILQETMRRYAIEPKQIEPLDAFESFIYEFQRGDERFILRVGHSLRRSVNLIAGEVDWINYLAKGGVSVARAIHSERGELVEAIDDGHGDQFLATAFVKAPGGPARKEDWTPARYEAYGHLLGQMHALSKDYQPTQLAWKRLEWDDPIMEFAEQFLPPGDAVILEKYRTLIKYLNTLPKDNALYGLIHQDAHQGNFFMDEDGTITLFDFDDCVYSWYINDIAIVLFYMAVDKDDSSAFVAEFMSHFLRGYRRAYSLNGQWLKEIPNFLKLREIDLYAVIHRDFDVANLTNPWVSHFMHNRRERLKNGVPFIDFDFESLR